MKKKVFALSLALGALALILSAGTLAYFTDTDNVVNTFTLGNVDIELDEAKVELENGTYVAKDSRVKSNTYEGLFANQVVPKDPTVKNVGNTSAYLRVNLTVDNLGFGNIFGVDAPYEGDPSTITEDMLSNVLVGYDADKWDFTPSWSFFDENIKFSFVYTGTLAADETVTLFDSFKLPSWLSSDSAFTQIASSNGFTMDITADAIQAEGFNDAATAIAAFDAQN